MDSLRAYNYLESAILTGRLKPRERLIEQELAEQLKMSRTPIREALRRLEERGLVRILPRRGALVSDISSAEVENIYAVRSHLESLAARLAAAHITPEGIERVRELEAAHAKQASGRDVRALMLANDRAPKTGSSPTYNGTTTEDLVPRWRYISRSRAASGGKSAKVDATT